jgi:hypothetical protein
MPIAQYTEVLDLGRFGSPQYKKFLRASLQEKYRDKPIGIIVAHGSAALEFTLEKRRPSRRERDWDCRSLV